MKNFSIIFLVFLTLSIKGFSQWTVKTVPDPKTTGTGFVSNPDDILSKQELTYLDSIIKNAQDSSKAEIAIVILNSIGDEVPKTFANQIFNLWGIGNKETNNGVLILSVMDQRRIEFETGYGIEPILTDAKCFDIQQEFMVPRFKEGNYGKGIIDGTNEIVRILFGRTQDIKPTDLDYSPSAEQEIQRQNNFANNIHSNFYTRNKGCIIFYLVSGLFFILLFFIILILSFLNKDYFIRYQNMRLFRLYIWFILFPVPFIGIYLYVVRLTEKWRNTPRISAKTGLIMHKLSETEDDKFLKTGQLAEEKVKSVDYDVWISEEEGDILIQSYKRWFSKYSACPKCKFKTYYKVYDRVITPATYSSSGTGEKHYSCVNCGHSKTVRYTIPQKTRTSSTSSSSRGGGSSWSSGGSSSWGGGRSGGGGAGSSW
jgi:uncharacterized protein